MQKTVSLKIAEDHIPEVLAELERRIALGLEACGQDAERYAKEDCPVDTGRLRGSITYVTRTKQSSPVAPATSGDSLGTGYAATVPKNEMHIGTRVEYAEAQEFGDFRHLVGKKHFLRDSLAAHVDRHKATLEAALSD